MSIKNYINFSQQVYSVLTRTCGINVAKHIVCFYSIILHNISLGLIVSIFSVVFFCEKTISSKGTVSQDFDFKQTLRIDSFIYRRGMYIPRITELKMTEWKTV